MTQDQKRLYVVKGYIVLADLVTVWRNMVYPALLNEQKVWVYNGQCEVARSRIQRGAPVWRDEYYRCRMSLTDCERLCADIQDRGSLGILGTTFPIWLQGGLLIEAHSDQPEGVALVERVFYASAEAHGAILIETLVEIKVTE